MRNNKMFEELEVIELAHNIKKNNLKKGERGAVVEIYKGGKAYEVEFVTPNGGTKALLTLMSDDIRPTVKTTEDAPYSLYVTHSLGKIFIENITNENLKLKIETHKSEKGKEVFHYPSATL